MKTMDRWAANFGLYAKQALEPHQGYCDRDFIAAPKLRNILGAK